MSICNPLENCRIKGCAAILKVSDCGGIDPVSGAIDYTLFEEMLDVTNFDFTESTEVEEIDVLGQCDTQAEPTTTSYNGNMSVIWCKDDPNHCLLRSGCSLNFCLSPTGEDAAAGACAYVGEILITSFGHSFNPRQNQALTIGFRGTGTLRRENWCTNVVPFRRRTRSPVRRAFSQKVGDSRVLAPAAQRNGSRILAPNGAPAQQPEKKAA